MYIATGMIHTFLIMQFTTNDHYLPLTTAFSKPAQYNTGMQWKSI